MEKALLMNVCCSKALAPWVSPKISYQHHDDHLVVFAYSIISFKAVECC